MHSAQGITQKPCRVPAAARKLPAAAAAAAAWPPPPLPPPLLLAVRKPCSLSLATAGALAQAERGGPGSGVITSIDDKIAQQLAFKQRLARWAGKATGSAADRVRTHAARRPGSVLWPILAY